VLAAEAQRRNFYQAGKQVFLGDGAPYNWTIQQGYFPHATPSNDFMHVICYVYLGAWAVAVWSASQAGLANRDEREHWQLYEGWLELCWQGRVAEVIEEMHRWQQRLGRPPPGEESDANDPREVLRVALTYLSNNQGRMD
jgi:hypothetical protein